VAANSEAIALPIEPRGMQALLGIQCRVIDPSPANAAILFATQSHDEELIAGHRDTPQRIGRWYADLRPLATIISQQNGAGRAAHGKHFARSASRHRDERLPGAT